MAIHAPPNGEMQRPVESGDSRPPPDQPPKKESPVKKSELEQIQTIRKVLGLDTSSPLKAKEALDQEKKEITDRFLEERQREHLARGRGFIDRNKSTVDERGEGNMTGIFNKANRFVVVEALRMAKAQNPEEIVDILIKNKVFIETSQMQDFKTFLAIKRISETLQPDNLQLAFERMHATGLGKTLYRTTNPSIIDAIARIGNAPEEVFTKVCEQLNPYYFLDTPSLYEHVPNTKEDVRLSKGAKIIIDALDAGGLTEGQITKLEQQRRLSLLDHGVAVVQGEWSNLGQFNFSEDISLVMENDIDDKTLAEMEDFARDSVKRRIKYRVEDTLANPQIYENIYAMQHDGLMPFVRDLTNAGVECLSAVNQYSTNPQSEGALEAKKMLTGAYALLSDPTKFEWIKLFQELRGEEQVQLHLISNYDALYAQRGEMGDLFTFIESLEQLPEEFRIDPRESFSIHNDKRDERNYDVPQFAIHAGKLYDKLGEYLISHRDYSQEGSDSPFSQYIYLVRQHLFKNVSGSWIREEYDLVSEDLPLLAHLAANHWNIETYITRASWNPTPQFSARLIEDMLDGTITGITPQKAAEYVERFYVTFSPKLLNAALSKQLPIPAEELKRAITGVVFAQDYDLTAVDARLLQPFLEEMGAFSFLRIARKAQAGYFDETTLSEAARSALHFSQSLSPEGWELVQNYQGDFEHLSQNGVASFALLTKTASTLPDKEVTVLLPADYESKAALSENQRKAVQFLRNTTFKPGVQSFVLELIAQNGECIDSNGNVTIAFFEKALQEGHFDNVKNLLEQTALNTATPQQKIFWQCYLEADPTIKETILSNKGSIDKLIDQNAMDEAKIKPYIDVITRIGQSPSQEIQRLKNQLVPQILQTDDPVSTYRQVEEVFVKNNLPTVGKVFRVFEILYPAQSIEAKIKGTKLSPVLQQAGERRRYDIIYRDLLRAHIGSANHSLKEFATFLKDAEVTFDTVLAGGTVSATDEKKARYALQKFETLRENSLFGRLQSEQMPSVSAAQVPLDFPSAIAQVRQSLRVRERQTITDRVAEMFLRPAGYRSLDEMLLEMQHAKTGATQRGERLYEGARIEDGERFLTLSRGDLVKGVQEQYIENILQNGVVAKEYLGASADSDRTPFGTDATEVTQDDATDGFTAAFRASAAAGYGNLAFVFKDRGQFQDTLPEQTASYDQSKYEVYAPGVVGLRHRDIRTGLPSSEIDFMVAQDTLATNQRELEKVYYAIAQQGVYVPVADKTGQIIFTPEMYQEYRATFSGIERFEGDPLQIVRMEQNDPLYEQMQDTVAQIKRDEHAVRSLSQKVREIVDGVLEENGIALQDEFDTGLLGAQLYDIGSSGRHTNVPQDYDFDLTLILDALDMPKSAQIKDKLIATLQPERDESHAEENGFIQVRAMATTAILPERPLDVDIGISPKSVVRPFATHDAIKTKLSWIREHEGDDAYYEALANIVIAKRVLKEAHAYKKLEDGGFGGVGTENWILANKGNFYEAARTFLAAAEDQEGNVRSLEEFRKRYRLLDAGVNLKNPYHDNFVYTLKENGYQAMVATLKQYAKTA